MNDLLSGAIAASDMVHLEIARIREPHQALRGPERHNPNYGEMRDSIRAKGVYLPILVRPDGDRDGYGYVVIDGMQRFTISRETGKETIPARILRVTPLEALEIQVIANLHRVDTTPIQYAMQLQQMIAVTPGLTAPKLAVKLDKSPTWVYNLLGLLSLHPQVASLVEQGRIVLANAQALAKLPGEYQVGYLDLALAQQPQEFTPKMTEIARQIKEGGRSARNLKEYIHVDRFQKMTSVRGEIDHAEARKALFRERGEPTPEQAWRLALEWVLHRDPISVRAAKAKEARLLRERAAKEKELAAEARKRRGA